MFDAHCHVQDPRFLDGSEELRAARKVGVKGFLCCATRPGDWRAVEELAEAHGDLTPFFGLHPWYVAEEGNGWKDALERVIENCPRAGIGEIGLDEALDPDERGQREEAFRFQLRLARRQGRPLALHCRRAFHRLLPILAAEGPFEGKFLVHSFSDSAENLAAIVELGGYVSFSGSLTHPHAARARKACRLCPPERLLAETDGPDMMPRDLHGQALAEGPTRLHMLERVVEEISILRMETVEAMTERLDRNVQHFLDGIDGSRCHA